MLLQRIKNKGVLTVEASLVLPIFMFLIITILSLINIASLQARMQVALNMSARQISEYGYFYSLIGGNSLNDYFGNKAEAANNLEDSLSTAFNEIANLGNDSFDLSASFGKVKDIEDAAKKVYEDPKSLIYYFANKAQDKIEKEIGVLALKALMKQNLKTSPNANLEKYLKNSGIIANSSGSYFDKLDFSNTKVFQEGEEEWVKCEVGYDVKIIQFLPINLTFHFEQCAITRVWNAKSFTYSASKSSSIWNSMDYEERNEFIRNQGMQYYIDNENYKKVNGGDFKQVQLYNAEKNSILSVTSYDPLSYHNHNKVEDITETEIIATINRLCDNAHNDIYYAQNGYIKGEDGNSVYFHSNVTPSIVLVIPEDNGIKEKITTALQSSEFNNQGVFVEIVTSYGESSYNLDIDIGTE